MTERRFNRCEELLKEFKELEGRTALVVESYVPGKPLNPRRIVISDLIRKEEIRSELLRDCKEFLKERLSPEELFEIENEES